MFSLVQLQPSRWIRKILVIAFLVVLMSAPIFAQTITVTSPDGGETWYKGTQYNITWTSVSVTGRVKITLRDASSEVLVISNNTANDGTDPWTIPSTLTDGNYRVRVESRNDSNIYDDSDSTFAIAPPPTITVTAPNGGEHWEVSSAQQITWTTTGTVGDLKIEYSIDSGANWTEIVSSITSGTGSYDWTIPSTPSEDCLVNISETSDGLSDTSDATFSIVTVAGLLNVVINPQGAIDSGAQWKLTSEGNWHGSGETVSYSPADDHILEFKAILGWSKPADKTIIIEAGITTYETGTYEKITLVTDVDQVTVPEGGTADFKVKLSGEPSSEVSVTVNWQSGDTDITVRSGSSLKFSRGNWDNFKTVKLDASEDDDLIDGEATILVSAPEIEAKQITATEDDNDELKFVIDKNRVTVPEGGEDTFKIKISSRPLSDVLVTISKAANGDEHIIVLPDDPAELTFSLDDWNDFQTVTLAAEEDDDIIDGEAIIQIRAPGFEEIDILAVEQDNDFSDIFLKLNPSTATTGNIIKISIEISNNTQEIDAFGLDFIYDDSLFTVKSIKKGSLTSDWGMIGGEETISGTIIVGGIAGGGQPIYEDSKGTLVRIWLKVKCDSLLEETPSEVKIENYKDGILGFSPERCTEIITLVPCSRVGDVNGDGDLTPGDAQNTLEIYLGKRVPEFCQETTSDSNGDERTTPGDAQDIFECYLGKKELPECHEDGSNGTSSVAAFASFSKIRVNKRLRPSKPKLYALNTIGFPGRTVNIPIIITDPEGISSFSFEVNYLPELLEYTGIRRSQLTDEFDYLTGIEEIKGLVRVEGESKWPVEYNKYASLAVLAFRVKEGASGNWPIIVFNPGKDLFNVEIDDGTFLGLEYFNEHERFLTLGKAIITPDKTLRIPVRVSDAFNIKSFGLEIKYPQEKMLFVGINRGDLTKNFTTVEGNESEPGIVRVGGYNTSGIQEKEPGMLAEIVFFIKDMDGKIEIVNLVDDIQDFIVQKRRIRVNEKRIRDKKLWFRK
jgi:hypothetical protein